jgi:hypothetical protein
VARQCNADPVMARRRQQRRPTTSFKKGSSPRNASTVANNYPARARLHNQRRRLNRLAFAVARLCHGPSAALVPRPTSEPAAIAARLPAFPSSSAGIPPERRCLVVPRCAVVSQAANANSVVRAGSGCLRRRVRLFMRWNRMLLGVKSSHNWRSLAPRSSLR